MIGRAIRWWGTVSVAAVLTLASWARGEGAQNVRLEYRAPATCPDQAALVTRIRARVDVRTVSSGEGVPSFGVTVESDGDRIVGRIASTNERREPTSREVAGTDCSHVVDAVALVIAMALSPTGANDAATPIGSRPSDKLTLPQPLNRETIVDRKERSRPEGAHWKILGSGHVEGAFVYAPTASVAVGARVQVFRTASYVGGPSVALGYASVLATDRVVDGAHASLAFDIAELFVCPVSVTLGPSFTLLPCARLDLGQVVAKGSGVANPRTEARLWGSVGALGQLVFVAAKPFVIDAQASLLVPFTPYRFVFNPDSVIYGAPRVGFSTSLAVGIMFL